MKNKSLIAMMFMTLFSFSLVGCNDQATQKSEPYIEDFTQVEFEKLMKYRDSYVGDNSAVINIVTGLPGNRYNPSFNLQTQKEPYEIAINYTVNDEEVDESYLNFWNDNNPEEVLENNAIILFSLISNVDLIEFDIDGIDSLSNHSYKYSREELESKYNLELADLSANEDSLDDFFKEKE